jgi:predicted kinase
MMAAAPQIVASDAARWPCAPPFNERSPGGQTGARFIPSLLQAQHSTADQNRQRLDGAPRILRTHWWRGDDGVATRGQAL